MTVPVLIEVPGVPVAKGRPRHAIGRGERPFIMAYTPAATRLYEEQLRFAGKAAMSGAVPLTGPLAMEVTVYVPIPMSFTKKRTAAARAGYEFPAKKPDADNFAKIAMDGLNGIVYGDDSQIVDLHVQKLYSDQPRLCVRVTQKATEATRAAEEGWGPLVTGVG